MKTTTTTTIPDTNHMHPSQIRRPMQVCFVIDNLSRAGTELQLLKLIENLDREKIEPHLFLLDGSGEESKELEPIGFSVQSLGVKRLCSYRAFRAARRFRRYLKRYHIDLVQTYFIDSTRFAAPIARSVGCPVFGARRNIGHAMTRLDRRIARFYNRHFIDKIIVNSEAVRLAVIEQEKMQPSDVIVIPNGIELEPFQFIKTWQNLPVKATKNIGMVANLREVKGVDLFIHAAAKIRDRYPGTLFQIAGKGDLNHYTTLINELNLSDCVQLLGAVEAIPRFLENIDIAVLPSRAEGLSNALLEYMASGRPIIATNVGGNPELIDHEQTGLLVASENVDALADAMARLLDDTLLSERLATKARQTITQNYSAESIAARHEAAYNTHRAAT